MDSDITGPHDATQAVPFDPFADDDSAEEFSLGSGGLGELGWPTATAGAGGGAAGAGPSTTPISPGTEARLLTSELSHQKALDTFRALRTSRRADRLVADGMVTLPFIEWISPEEALIEPPTPDSPSGSSTSFSTSAAHPHRPQLQPGDVVAGQYEIMGVIAHGGLGWIYVAHDRNVADRVVVLKGLNATAREAVADVEHEFLADITHPEIVKIFNFIDDSRVPGGMIVMEYVGGPPLSRRARDYPGGLMPVDIAAAYLLEVLPAVEYLHQRGVVYNDMKPENIIATEDQVKLIDLGAVSGIGAYGYIYGTRGYQAPEVATSGPSIASDMYAIGRTLAALTVKLPRDEHGALLPGLPSPNEEPLFSRHISFYRLLVRLTHPDPAQRFNSVAELRTQIYGVLREVIALRDGRTFPHQHSLFSPQRRTFGTKHIVFRTDQLLDGVAREATITPIEVIAALPVPLVDRHDPAAGILAGMSYTSPEETLETLQEAAGLEEYSASKEIKLGIVRAMLDLGFSSRAQRKLDEIAPLFPHDWRFHWYSGIAALTRDDLVAAQDQFSYVLELLPGESAPKLALAAVSEMLLNHHGGGLTALLDGPTAIAAADLSAPLNQQAEGIELPSDWIPRTSNPVQLRFHALRLYAMVWLTNPSTVSSAFGLSRQLMAENQLEPAIAALDRVPQASRHHRMAQLTAILELVSGDLSEARIRRAAARLARIPTNEPRFLQVKTAILVAGLTYLRAAQAPQAVDAEDLLEFPFTDRDLRLGLSATLREQARNAPDPKHRYALVDIANRIRPVTWF